MRQPQYWFRAGRYGRRWGLPCAWQGWAVLTVFFFLFVTGFFLFPPQHHPAAFVGYNLFIVIEFSAICYLRGEPSGRRRGQRSGSSCDSG